MKLAPMRVADIARLTQATVEGDAETALTGIAPIDQARAGDLSFVAQARFVELLADSPAAAVFVDQRSAGPSGHDTPILLRVANPYFAFVQVLRHYLPAARVASEIAATAQIGAGVRLGPGVVIGPYAVIEEDCDLAAGVQIGPQCFVGRSTVIGEQTLIFAGVRIAPEVQIGKRVIIQYGSVIGSDGFGYLRHEGRQHKIPHLGTVVLEDEVEIGANCCIDRGTFGETRLQRGAKLDNLVHVAHNVVIGENTVIAAQTGISGSTSIGRDVIVAGQVGFVGHIEIGDRAILGAQAGVTKSIPAGLVVSGYPARDHRKARREEAAIRRLPQLLQRMRAVEKLLKLESRDEGTHDTERET